MLFTIKLDEGGELVGTVRAVDVRCEGVPLRIESVIAFDRHTVFLEDGTQHHLDGHGRLVSGFLEVGFGDAGERRLIDVRRVTALTRAPSGAPAAAR